MKEVRVGVIGAGHWGKNLVRNFVALDVLHGIADFDENLLDAYEREYPGIFTTSDPDVMLASDDVDALVIATPAETHGDLVEASLKRGKHTFVEKPLCLSLTQAQRLVALAEAEGLVLMVGHLMLYHPGFHALSELLQRGTLGQLRYVYSNRLSLGRIRRFESALWSFAPHDISMILNLTRRLPTSVMASGGHYVSPGVADTTLTQMDFSGGVQAHIFVSWLHPYKDQRLIVVGEDGMAVFNDAAAPDRKLLLYRHGVSWEGNVPVVSEAPAESLSFSAEEPLHLECKEFIAATLGLSSPASNGREGLRVLQVLDACERAIRSGTRVQVSDVADE